MKIEIGLRLLHKQVNYSQQYGLSERCLSTKAKQTQQMITVSQLDYYICPKLATNVKILFNIKIN